MRYSAPPRARKDYRHVCALDSPSRSAATAFLQNTDTAPPSVYTRRIQLLGYTSLARPLRSHRRRPRLPRQPRPEPPRCVPPTRSMRVRGGTTHDARHTKRQCVRAHPPHRIRVARASTSASFSPSRAFVLGYGPSQQPRRLQIPHSHASSARFVWASTSLDTVASRASSSSCVRAHSDASSSARTITVAGGQAGVIL
ncbi:hypothetical protein B0H17DRAFT_1331402 [Mycena rosella]|uniref:Uncharacterized protein n=1 Tax=Mycena rosella TaxID=1033263 RepID=A0AAD7DFZ7_MYCRO|nr:hypothetical protein B0H17DRAFT_1331402 [Mycena rosella]